MIQEKCYAAASIVAATVCMICAHVLFGNTGVVMVGSLIVALGTLGKVLYLEHERKARERDQ